MSDDEGLRAPAFAANIHSKTTFVCREALRAAQVETDECVYFSSLITLMDDDPRTGGHDNGPADDSHSDVV